MMKKILALILLLCRVAGQRIQTGNCVIVLPHTLVIIRLLQQNSQVTMMRQPALEGPSWQPINPPPWLHPINNSLQGHVPKQLPQSIKLDYVFDGWSQHLEFLLVEEANANNEICNNKWISLIVERINEQTSIWILVNGRRRMLVSQLAQPQPMNPLQIDEQSTSKEVPNLQVQCGQQISNIQKLAYKVAVLKAYLEQVKKQATQIQDQIIDLLLKADNDKYILAGLMKDQLSSDQMLQCMKTIKQLTLNLMNITQFKQKIEGDIQVLMERQKQENGLNPQTIKVKKEQDSKIKYALERIVDSKDMRLNKLERVIELMRETQVNQDMHEQLKNYPIPYAIYYKAQNLKLKRVVEQIINNQLNTNDNSKKRELEIQYANCIKNPKTREIKTKDPSCWPSQIKRKIASGLLTFLGEQYVRISNLKIRRGECTLIRCQRGPLEKFDRVIYETSAVGDDIWANKITCVL